MAPHARDNGTLMFIMFLLYSWGFGLPIPVLLGEAPTLGVASASGTLRFPRRRKWLAVSTPLVVNLSCGKVYVVAGRGEGGETREGSRGKRYDSP